MSNNVKIECVTNNLSVDAYKSAYEAARRILCDAEASDPVCEETIQKCMWISAMAETMGDIPMHAASLACADYSLRDSGTLIRKTFPRRRSWNKLFGEKNMDIILYAMVYEDICNISRDADDFDVYGQFSDEEVEKCEWISAICEVIKMFLNITKPCIWMVTVPNKSFTQLDKR